MLARDLMSSPAITIEMDTTCQDALQLLEKHRCRRLPVVDQIGHLVGIVSLRDLPGSTPSLPAPLTSFEQHYLLYTIPVREVMKKTVVTANPGTPIEYAAHLMVENQVSGLPVVDEQNRVVGMIAETDLLKALVAMLAKDKSEV